MAGHLEVTPTSFDVAAAVQPGTITHSTTAVTAAVDGAGLVGDIRGPSLLWGRPDDANLRWGVLFGFHAGMGRLDTTSTPLPSGGLYIGGMLGPRLGLVGNFSMVTGKDDAGGAIGFAWGLSARYWPLARLSVEAGPAFVLALDPGFTNTTPDVGGSGAISYALVRGASFVLDLRFDATVATSTAFGCVGVGVNVN